jgi:flagellar basal-body rod protein FlgB
MSSILEKAVFDRSGIPLLKKYLDISSFRHKLVSGNIANVSTPGFKSSDIDFHGELRKAIDDRGAIRVNLTHPNHIPIGHSPDRPPQVIVNKSENSNGINNVDIDLEVTRLAKNQIYYNIGARLLSNKFRALKNVIKSG